MDTERPRVGSHIRSLSFMLEKQCGRMSNLRNLAPPHTARCFNSLFGRHIAGKEGYAERLFGANRVPSFSFPFLHRCLNIKL